MEPGKLVRRSTELTGIGNHSLRPQEAMLLKELDLTATNAKTALTPELNKEWLRVLSSHPAEAIEAAFRKWREVSPFFPTISEVLDLVEAWHCARREDREAREREQERLQTEQARARGELIDFTDIKDLCRKVAAQVQGPVPQFEQMAKPMDRPQVKRADLAPPELTPEKKAELRRQLDEELAKRRR
jgi:hypothetical protein